MDGGAETIADKEAIRRRAVATYALYRCYNGARTGRLSLQDLPGAYMEFQHEGNRGSREP
eukprot:9183073-Pyramimonas_sp.AAC.1